MHSGGGIEATAIGDGEMQRRSFPNSFRGHMQAAGYEHIRTLGLVEEAERIGGEAVELLSRARMPERGHDPGPRQRPGGAPGPRVDRPPVELDRVLGMEEAYAGTSFVRPEDRGTLRYGSPLVTITADATLAGGLGSFGCDDEGVPAQRTPIIDDGVFQHFISSRETAPQIGEVSTRAPCGPTAGRTSR